MIAHLLAATLLALPLVAQDAPQESEAPPERIRSVVLYGEETCPPAAADEIVVCARGDDSPYRIPKRFREQPAEVRGAQGGTARAELIEEVNRAGLPGSCSPIGTGGQTGCTRAWIRQWAQERLEARVKAAREQAPEKDGEED